MWCETCKRDTTKASILLPFIFIVKFSDRGGVDMDRKYFSIIWTKMIPVAQFIQYFPVFWLDTLFCEHFKLSLVPKEKSFYPHSYSLTDLIDLSLGWAWFSFMFLIYFTIYSLGSYIHKLTSVTQILPICLLSFVIF